MRRALIAAILATATALPVIAEEKPLNSRITSVGLFKNGLAVVRRTATVPGPGTYRLEDVPEPVHGTFWVESNAKVTTRLTRQLVEVPATESPSIDFQEELAGKEVVIHFADGKTLPVTGTVVAMAPPRGDAAWSRAYEQPRYNSFGFRNQHSPGRMLVLKTAKGRSYVDSARIAHLEAVGAGDTVRKRKPVMLFTVEAAKEKPAVISITYLAKGMAWAPSYRVDISDPKKLVLQQKAVIKNELESLQGAEVQLISGFPSIQFANVTSPLSLNTTWTKFFQQLNQRYSPGHPSTGNVISQRLLVYQNATSPDGGIDMSATPTGEGVDLHYQSIGQQTLDEGDSLAVETASAKADYERIVEWIVPDNRQANGSYVSNEPDKYQDAAWDAVRFRNPLAFPMTTAPAMIVASDGHFNGQRLSYWVNSGEETTLHVTKALSIRTRSVEQEVEGERETVYVGGARYRKTIVDGELTANNHRKESVTLVIRRHFSGNLVKADRSPKCTLLEEGIYSANKRNQLAWSLELKPGEEVKLSYQYTVLVRF